MTEPPKEVPEDIITSIHFDRCVDRALEDAHAAQDYQELNRVLARYVGRVFEDFVSDPCCDDRSMEHMMITFAMSCMGVGFYAGRRAASAQIPGVENGEIDRPTRAEAQEAWDRSLAAADEAKENGKNIQQRILSALGATVENGVIKMDDFTGSEEDLQRLLQEAMPGARVAVLRMEDGEEKPPPTGMYL